MAQEVITVTVRSEHSAVGITEEGVECTLYRGNLQRHQRNPKWDWETITIGTQVKATLVTSVKPRERLRGIEILIITP